MKKIVLSLTMLVVALTASAQFQQGKGYIGASLSGLNLSYNSENGLNLGVQTKAAGKIHTDFEKGFIRAEVVSFAMRCPLRV